MTEFQQSNCNSYEFLKSTCSTTSCQETKRSYQYRLKIYEFFEKCGIKVEGQISLYLNLIFSDLSQIQTHSIDIPSNKNIFEINTLKAIDKIQVIDYDSLKKLAKISLKGTQREFNITYKDSKRGLILDISRRNLTTQSSDFTTDSILSNRSNFDQKYLQQI